jgi:hypothetical protein
MKLACAKKVDSVENERGAGGQAQSRMLLLALVCFFAGVAVSALWLKHSPSHGANSANVGAEGAGTVPLSETTLAVLQRLNGPVEIRFYCLLDKSMVTDAVPAFANRVDRLLSAYESAANGKLKVSRINSQSYANVNAASADGVKEFNRDKGDPCFLGLTISFGGHKETLASLAPEWEAALEGDVTRAIARVAEAGEGLQPAVTPVAANSVVLDAVKLALTNLDAIPLEEGTRILREAALNEFAQATKEMETRLKEAQQRVVSAGTNASSTEAAMKQLQQLQAEQTAKLTEIAARAQQQIQALQQYKSVAR